MSYFIERGWAQPGGIEEKIELTHAPTAKEIVRCMKSREPLMVVTGSLGIGKSDSLIPLSRKLLHQAGFVTILKDGQQTYWWNHLTGIAEFKKEIETGHGERILVIDEAAHLVIRGNGGQEKTILDIAYQNNVQVVAINAINVDAKDARKKVISAWVNAGSDVCRRKPTAIDIGSPRITRILAKAYLEDRFRKQPPYGRPLNDEAIRYVLDNVPYNIGVLHIIANNGLESLMDVMQGILNNVDNQVGRISQDEARRIKDKVANDWWNLTNPKRK